MIHHRSCPMCIIYTSALTMGNSSQWPRRVIPPIRRWCTIVSTELPKSMNWLWTIYLLTRNPWLVSSIQFLIDPSQYNVRDMSWMLKSMLVHLKDNKGIVKSYFATSCLAFRGLNPNSIFLPVPMVLVQAHATLMALDLK